MLLSVYYQILSAFIPVKSVLDGSGGAVINRVSAMAKKVEFREEFLEQMLVFAAKHQGKRLFKKALSFDSAVK